MADKVERSQQDIQELFEDQIAHLEETANLFDAGQTASYRRLSASLRILVHSTRISISLLSQMGLTRRAFLSCARAPDSKNELAASDLIALFAPGHPGKSPTWYCGLDDWAMEFVTLEEWWECPVLSDRGQLFTRKSLVLSVANQDGGAHVDPAIDAAFQKMRTEGMRWTNGRSTTESPDRFAIRTIAHEMLKSLKPEYKRRPRFDDQPHAIARSLFFGKGRADKRDIKSYHLLRPQATCPCLSGLRFSECHGIGALAPRLLQNVENTAVAPPGAAYARVMFGVGPR